ncbi:hypothetical protein CR66_04920 [Campylobacter mucosalis]|uniref:hypothetical protein n=1 Tax=Campylobacter mucosalis TaxID=202 RepID=UPI0004D6AA72|nr:hypothetical protein [Campylobacter mucosalis]KEA45761.1 hypothetical protein CR66_04920 [Campylobacter mucosalis]QKF62276.1 hypothetical protein CMCT_0107 [Campylobacter mucosalis]
MVKKAALLVSLLSCLFGSEVESFTFKTDNTPSAKLFVKAILISIENLNANVTNVNELNLENGVIYGLSVQKDGGVDVAELKEALAKNGLVIKTLERESDSVYIVLDSSDIRLDVTQIQIDTQSKLDRTNSAYFIGVDRVPNLLIKPAQNSTWLPLIYGYDRNLNQIFQIKKDEVARELKLDLTGIKYLLIGDSVDMNNIKGGLLLTPER